MSFPVYICWAVFFPKCRFSDRFSFAKVSKGHIANSPEVPLPELFSKLGRIHTFEKEHLFWDFLNFQAKIEIVKNFQILNKNYGENWWREISLDCWVSFQIGQHPPSSCSPRPCIIRKYEKRRSLQQSKTRWVKIENRISAKNFGAKIARKWISWKVRKIRVSLRIDSNFPLKIQYCPINHQTPENASQSVKISIFDFCHCYTDEIKHPTKF